MAQCVVTSAMVQAVFVGGRGLASYVIGLMITAIGIFLAFVDSRGVNGLMVVVVLFVLLIVLGIMLRKQIQFFMYLLGVICGMYLLFLLLIYIFDRAMVP